MHDPEMVPVVWRKSTFSELNGCVEVGFGYPSVLVRDSKTLNSDVLSFSRSEWDSFTKAIRLGRFDIK